MSAMKGKPVDLLKARQRVRRYCFTFNNPNGIQEELFKQNIVKVADCGGFGKEVGEAGTPHWQGWIKLKKQTYFKNIHACQ